MGYRYFRRKKGNYWKKMLLSLPIMLVNRMKMELRKEKKRKLLWRTIYSIQTKMLASISPIYNFSAYGIEDL